METEKTKIIFNKTMVGYIEGDTYISYRNTDHLMRMFNSSFGLSKKVLGQLFEKGVKTIIFDFDMGMGKRYKYKCPIMKFMESDKVYTYNHGEEEDEQKFVSLVDMEML